MGSIGIKAYGENNSQINNPTINTNISLATPGNKWEHTEISGTTKNVSLENRAAQTDTGKGVAHLETNSDPQSRALNDILRDKDTI